MTNSRDTSEFVVLLPSLDFSPLNYGSVRKIARTHAKGPREAVSRVVSRGAPNNVGLILDYLDSNFGGDCGQFAYEVLEVYAEDGTELSGRDRVYFRECFLADEIARRNGLKQPKREHLNLAAKALSS